MTNKMKQRILLLLLPFLCLSVCAQEAVSVSELTELAQTDVALGQKSVAVFLSKTNNLVITSSNTADVVSLARRQADGRYAVEVACDVSEQGVNQRRTFSVLIKNTSLKSSKAKTMKAGRRFYFEVTQADHMLDFWWPEKNGLYAIAGKSCVEFHVPIDVKGLKLRFPDGIGARQLDDRTENGLNILSLEIDAKQLEAYIADMEARQKAADAAELAYQKCKDEVNANLGKKGFDLTAAEVKEQQLERSMQEAVDKVPVLSIVLYGDNTNQVALGLDKVKLLTQPKFKLNVGVNDALRHGDSFDGLLAKAREYYQNYPAHTESSYFDAARIAYDNAIGHDDCPQGQRDALREERNKMAAIRQKTYFVEKCDTMARQFEAQKGFECEEVYKYLGGQHKFLTELMQDYPELTGLRPIDAAVEARLNQHPKTKVTVKETVTVKRQIVSGKVSFKNEYVARPFNTLKVYSSPTSKIDRTRSKLIGSVNADGTYSVILPDDTLYIYVTGEKEAHYVGSGTSKLDIVIK